MSAKDQIRAMLDELMGTSRNGNITKQKIYYDDPKVCKLFLLGCCPHDILQATRVDLGECRKIHDFALKADYEQAAEKRKDLNYEIIAFEALEEFINDCDRKKEIAKRRLKETQEELGEEAAKKMNRINEYGEQIGTKIAKAEELGNTGQVEESMKLLEEVEEIKKLKYELESEFRNSTPSSTYQQQKLRVCEVCSAYLGIHDNDRRLADHFGGKLHLGFILLRDKLEELRERVKEIKRLKLEKRSTRDEEDYKRTNRERRSSIEKRSSRDRRRSRSRSTSRSKKSRSSKNQSKSRSRSRSKHKTSSHRKRSNSKTKKHKRSRSRSSSSSNRHYDSKSKKRSHKRSRSSSRSRNSKINEIKTSQDENSNNGDSNKK